MKRRILLLSAGMFVAALWPAAGFGQILDPFTPVSTDSSMQGWPQAAYNPNYDEYLVVWEDYRTTDSTGSDIYGQLVYGNGTLRGANFPICTAPKDQYWPHVDFDKYHGRYLVVFEDQRNHTGDWDWVVGFDCYGALLDMEGHHVPTATSEADTCFPISTNYYSIHYSVVAFNDIEQTWMAAWADYRNETIDIYGQLIDADGNLLPPPDPADPDTNFQVLGGDGDQDVPDISYSSKVNEWLVACASGDWEGSSVVVQRVSATGELLKVDGTDGAEPYRVSEETNLWTDGVQPRVQFNNEWRTGLAKATSQTGLCEALVAWVTDRDPYYDLYGHRVAIIPDADAVALGLKNPPASDSTFFMTRMDTEGNLGAATTDEFPISNADGDQEPAELAFSQQDNEFIIGFGDMRRTMSWDDEDFYCQRLWVAPDSEMVWLNVDRSATVTSAENIVVEATPNYEGNFNTVAAAHSSHRNEFFLVYCYIDTGMGLNALARSNLEVEGSRSRTSAARSGRSVSGNSTDATATMMASDLRARRIAGSSPTGVSNELTNFVPERFEVSPNYPNPFNPSTTLRFVLPTEGKVTVELFDITGRKIRTLLDEVRPAGFHSVVWDSRDDTGTHQTSGVYLCRVRTGGQITTRKIMLVR